MMSIEDVRTAYTHIDLCVFSVVEGQFSVLMIRRTEAPEFRKWVLPGAALDTRSDANLDAAAKRACRERLRVDVPDLQQFLAVGGRQEMTNKWIVNVVYRAFVQHQLPFAEPHQGPHDRKWLPMRELSTQPDIGFNHREIIGSALAQVRQEVDALTVPFSLLPASFTMLQLRTLCEQILERPLDKASFRRRVLTRELLEETGQTSGGAHRPAMLYRPLHSKRT